MRTAKLGVFIKPVYIATGFRRMFHNWRALLYSNFIGDEQFIVTIHPDGVVWG
jgi:hypothetical protein